MNKLEIEEILIENKWQIQGWFTCGSIFVADRGFSTIVGYPKSGKYRENGTVNENLLGRLRVKKRSKPYITEQVVAKDEWINQLLTENEKLKKASNNERI